MLLAIDVGNTNIVFAVYDGSVQQGFWRLETQADASPIFEDIANQFQVIKDVIISSVVPKVNDKLAEASENFLKLKPFFVTHDKIDLTIALDNPDEVGADRLVNAVAAKVHYQCPVIIVDFGTATTFDVINAQGEYAGGVIAPGINLSLKALEQAAAKLPHISVERPDYVIGKNTTHAMQSGIYWGYIGLIEGTLKRIAEEMAAADSKAEKPYVIATGGLASLFGKGTTMIDAMDQYLTMKGLVYLNSQMAKQNNERKSA